jgi:hypothetical protein
MRVLSVASCAPSSSALRLASWRGGANSSCDLVRVRVRVGVRVRVRVRVGVRVRVRVRVGVRVRVRVRALLEECERRRLIGRVDDHHDLHTRRLDLLVGLGLAG